MVPAAIAVLNGAGEMTGRSQVDEYGLIETPILITNTASVGAVHRGCVEWLTGHHQSRCENAVFVIPVVAETFDGFLNDVAGQHVTSSTSFRRSTAPEAGEVVEGNVGGGTGMTAVRLQGRYRHVIAPGPARRSGLYRRRAGAGEFWPRAATCWSTAFRLGARSPIFCRCAGAEASRPDPDGSIIVVIGTDAPHDRPPIDASLPARACWDWAGSAQPLVRPPATS